MAENSERESNNEAISSGANIGGANTKEPTASPSALDIVLAYHNLTKHRFTAYAPGPDTLDWDNQPNPFRFYHGCLETPLALGSELCAASLSSVLTGATYHAQPKPLSLDSIAALLRTSFSLTAWKQYGPDRWSLRVNPSSGNLHPTETYLVLDPALTDADSKLPSGLLHYQPNQHSLEHRGAIDSSAGLNDGFLMAFSSILWRESWKYGERAFRYCQLDLGHALAAAQLAAASLGWRCYWLPSLPEGLMQRALGIQHSSCNSLRVEEREQADCCLYIATGGDCSKADNPQRVLEKAVALLQQIRDWQGTPNGLAEKSFYRWPQAVKVAKACAAGASPALVMPALVDLFPTAIATEDNPSFNAKRFDQVALRRRSAQRFVPAEMNKSSFLQLLSQLVQCPQTLLAHSEPIAAMHFVIAVHRVEGLQPGLYLLPGACSDLKSLRASIRRWPQWQAVDCVTNGSVDFQLYQLHQSELQKAVSTLCCQQAIAADCNFTIGFLARFEQPLNYYGPECYKRFFWQAGMIAQRIYLLATGLQKAATGIGCFFDDPWHELLGIDDYEYQFVYQMAVGTPFIDERITSYSGYYFLQDR